MFTILSERGLGGGGGSVFLCVTQWSLNVRGQSWWSAGGDFSFLSLLWGSHGLHLNIGSHFYSRAYFEGKSQKQSRQIPLLRIEKNAHAQKDRKRRIMYSVVQSAGMHVV